ncbi:transmembrane protein 107-like [Pyxicephalus adspersus]|uniref:transmembrane protein 107-like n=1 Tax=Pyxicephalus adspersus TaxID=30357 RepID=UPI003B5923EE
MTVINGLVPARFLTLLAHMVIVITIFWSRQEGAEFELEFLQSYRFNLVEDVMDHGGETSASTKRSNSEASGRGQAYLFRLLIVALSLTLGMFVIELAGFLSGMSMFNNTQGLLSVGAHASAGVAVLFYLFEGWQCSVYWWIFAFCR